MKKILKIAILIFIITIITITLIPANLFANGVNFGLNTFSDSPDEPTFFILWANNCSGLPYEFLITKNSTEIYKKTGTIGDNQWYELIEVTLAMDSYDIKLTINGYEPYTRNLTVYNWHGSTELSVNPGTSCLETLFDMSCNSFGPTSTWNFSISEYIGNGEWNLIYSNSGPVNFDQINPLQTIHNESRLLPEGLYYASFSVYSAHDFEVFYINSCDKSNSKQLEPVWIRDSEMKCKQVWINEENNFQFSFIYPYADNNWVRIYDMQGNMVYEIDMPLDNPNIIVDLPDGMYTVKTFHDQPEPLQTFIIGKP